MLNSDYIFVRQKKDGDYILKEKKFCHFCGFELQKKIIDGRKRLYCSVCKEPLYENPVPASCCVVVDQDKRVLLVQRSVEPKIGMWCLPGGFMEIGETPEETALRELNEETGVNGKISNILGVLSHPSVLYGTVSITGYSVEKFTGKFFLVMMPWTADFLNMKKCRKLPLIPIFPLLELIWRDMFLDIFN